MGAFHKGDIIVGKVDNGYGITTNEALMVVLDDDYYGGGNTMYVLVLAHAWKSEFDTYDVANSSRKFVKTTIEEYYTRYPNAHKLSKRGLTSYLKKYGINADDLYYEHKDTTPSLTPEELKELLSDEQKKELMKEIEELLKQYNYHPTEKGVTAIIDEWVKNKAPLIQMFKKHPNYNGKFQIAFDHDYPRIVDTMTIKDFCRYLKGICKNVLVEFSYTFTYEECETYYRKYNRLVDIAYSYEDFIDNINGMTASQLEAEKNKWRTNLKKYTRNRKVHEYNGRYYTIESYAIFENLYMAMDKFYYTTHNVLDSDDARYLNSKIPSLKAVAGQKTSRVMNKLCKLYGLDKDPEYNKMFAKYSDAINPLTIKRHTVLSIHPVDYYTMSFGNSWASCHTIDKSNVRGMDNSYHGAYSGGTESYMLDGTSMVLYTVDKDYDGNEYELQPKINRNMFHYGFDKLIQGRVYPQSNDSENGIYTTFREIVQKVISECIEDGVNSWLNVKGTSECYSVASSYGVHYRDYENFSACNVSYYKKEKDSRCMIIGHDPICPCCGETHSRESCIECEDCYDV